MRVYRIARTSFVRDLTGAGARTYGGRWNHKGTPLIYTSGTRSLAGLEYLVHLPMTLEPLDLSIATLILPDDPEMQEIPVSSLPRGWKEYPASLELADIGSDWVRTGGGLLLRVPSAVVQDEYNVLINPEHTDMNLIEIEDVRTFVFDERLLKRTKREA
jgi:RES domain-containing protein